MELFNSEKNFTLTYDQAAQPYHYVVAELAHKHMPDGGHRVLEVGCGVGHNLVELSKSRSEIEISIADIDPKCIEITSRILDIRQSLLIKKSAELNRLDEKYDCIILSHTLHYDDEPSHTLKLLAAKLTPDGVLIVATPNSFTLPILLNIILLRRNYTKGIFMWDFSTFRNYFENSLKMEICEVTSDYFPLPFSSRFDVLKRFGKRLLKPFPWMGFSVIFVVR